MIAIAQLAERIIREQELVIGPLALREAKKVKGLTVSSDGGVKISGDAKKTLGDLVRQYEKLFGKASLNVCQEAVRSLLPQVSKDEIPDVLK